MDEKVAYGEVWVTGSMNMIMLMSKGTAAGLILGQSLQTGKGTLQVFSCSILVICAIL
jgi:hypothetical protein